MTRANFNAFLKSMAWVVPLTVLIWVYAEREEPKRSRMLRFMLARGANAQPCFDR